MSEHTRYLYLAGMREVKFLCRHGGQWAWTTPTVKGGAIIHENNWFFPVGTNQRTAEEAIGTAELRYDRY